MLTMAILAISAAEPWQQQPKERKLVCDERPYVFFFDTMSLFRTD